MSRSSRADTDVCTRSRAVHAGYAAKYERIVLGDKRICSDRGCVQNVTGAADVRICADRRIRAADSIRESSRKSDKGIPDRLTIEIEETAVQTGTRSDERILILANISLGGQVPNEHILVTGPVCVAGVPAKKGIIRTALDLAARTGAKEQVSCPDVRPPS